MDPFKHSVNIEGCSSSESGWTSYIASAMQDDFECSEVNYNNHHNVKDDGEGNSDDSMVSDASSAPATYQYKQNHGQGSHTCVRVKHGKVDGEFAGKDQKEAKKEAKRSGESRSKSKRRLGSQAKSRK